MKRGKLILISGAARSGKSAFAEELVKKMDEPVAYLATAQVKDQEMAERIRLHVSRRPLEWTTIEEPLDLRSALLSSGNIYKTWLLDCVTLYVANLLFKNTPKPEGATYVATGLEEEILKQIELLLATIEQLPVTLVAVTNEVGWGLVPPEPLSRAYRDIIGKVNQRLAQAANEVYLVAMGLPMRLK